VLSPVLRNVTEPDLDGFVGALRPTRTALLSIALTLLLGVGGLVAARPAGAQEPERDRVNDRLGDQPAAWNDGPSLDVARAAIRARRLGRDNDLERFSAYAEGQVHYLAEYGDQLQDQAVRSDRIALELRWRRGVGSLQTIVGRRHVSWMPTTVEYHIDHLSLVVENFGDRIHIGDGDEVRDVLNPVAPGALDFYEYRLVDSLSMRINDRLTELYRLKVRPRDMDRPGVVGTIDVERRSFAVVRLAVTFTPSSYVDPTVRSVSVDLQNALISNRVWLPAEQHTEVRRQMRFLDLPFGGTIRTSFHVLNWDLDPPKNAWIPMGHRVQAVNDHDLKTYVGWLTWDPDGDPEELRADSALFENIRAEAVRVVRGHYLGGTSRLRLDVPSFSSLVRVRRAEGVFSGLGARYDLDGHWTARVHGGYAFGAKHGEVQGGLDATFGDLRFGFEAWFDRPADVGPWDAASGFLSTGGAVFRGEDYLDPYFERGGRVWVARPIGGGTAKLALASARQESAEIHLDPLGDDLPRYILPIQVGRDTRVTVSFDRELAPLAGSKLHLGADVDLAAFGDFDYTRWVFDFTATPTEPDATWGWEGRGGIGLVTGNRPIQRTLRFGGRGTVPGYQFRRFNGEQVAFVNLALSRSLFHPWFRLRALGALGWSHVDDDVVRMVGLVPGNPIEYATPDTGGLRPALGGGVSLVYDLVRLDVARGLDDGIWEWTLSVNPQFRAPL